MIDTKKTLTNLHERFPNMSLDDLFAVLECIAEFPVGVTWTSDAYIKGGQILGVN